MKKRIVLIILLIFTLLIHLKAQDSKYFFETISPESGFVFNEITTISSDKNRFIWFGCENGLYCYNGQSFQKYYYKKNDQRTIPSNYIKYIYRDSSNRMWICTRKGLAYFDEDNNNFRRVALSEKHSFESSLINEISSGVYLCLFNKELYKYNLVEKKLIHINVDKKVITTFVKDSHNSYLIGTSKGELYKFIIEDGYKVYKVYNGKKDAISSICIDRDWIYIGYKENGIDVISNKGKFIKSYLAKNYGHSSNFLPNDKVRKIIKQNNGEIWIGTFGGIVILKGNSVIVCDIDNTNLSSNSVYDIYLENDNTWVGCWSGGLSFYNPKNYSFKKKILLQNDIYKIGNVSSFAQKNKNQLWVGTEREGLILFDLTSKRIIKQIPLGLNIKDLLQSKEGLWIGTVENGLFFLGNNDNNIKKIELTPISRKLIISSLVPFEDELWIGTRGFGIIRYNLKNKEVKRFNLMKIGKQCNWIWQLEIDNHGDVYACTENGLLIKKSLDSSFKRIQSNDELLLYSIVPDEYNDFIIGSKNEGLFKFNSSTNKLSKFILDEALIDCDIYTIKKDINNNLWMSTNHGIYSYNLKIKELKHYSSADGLLGNQYHPIASAYINNEYMFWGGFNGFNYVDVNRICISKNNIDVDIVPINVFVNDHNILALDNIVVNSKYIQNINRIELNHNDNNISFRFSTNNVLKPQKNKIKYKLLGYENNWHIINQGDDIVYSKLNPGKYTLEYTGANNDGVWSTKLKKIDIIINPPFYKTLLAYIIYFIMILSILIMLYKFLKGRLKFKREIELEKYKNNVDQQVMAERTKFFMNISHELCTPLNLINAPLSILENKYMDKDSKFHLSTIRRNTNNLLRLTEQILDLRLLEVDKLKINSNSFDFNELSKDIIMNFDYYIKNKSIDFSYNSDNLFQKVVADKGMVEKIVYNLLLNSIKFTNEHGKIDFTVTKKNISTKDYDNKFYVGILFEGMALSFELYDNGTGIPNDKFNLIFERFQTLHNNNQDGSGIGLHICKEFVSMHKGNIIVESELGKWSKFTVNLPLVKENVVEKDKTPIVFKVSIDEKLDDNHDVDASLNVDTNKLILIIADNDETIFYLKRFLSEYRCLIAKNKDIGLKLSKESKPDIIVMDSSISMNNDFEIVKLQKSDKQTMNIPIIILSSISDQKTQYDCLCAGADLFLSKPIDEKLLKKHIDKLLNKSILDNVINNTINEVPLDFMKKVDLIIEQNLHYWDFDVNMLAEKMNISRSSLFRRIKSDSNCNISEYIKEKRLNRAISLMKNKCTNIEEIAIASGFNSSSYFCRCFKTTFGKTPKEYIKNLN